jgi:hypothetical protein
LANPHDLLYLLRLLFLVLQSYESICMVLALRSEFSTVYWFEFFMDCNCPCSEHEMSPYKFLQLKFFVVQKQ